MSYLSRNGFYPKLYINGRRIPDAQIDGGQITITHQESESSQMTVRLRPTTGAQDLSLYQGLPIILDIQKTATASYRVFTGIIDIDEYDVLNESIVLQCTDNRQNRIRALPAVVGSTGYYSEDIFGINNDLSEQMEKRLSTIPSSFDFDPYGNYSLTAWAPKTNADYTLTDSDVYRRTPKVTRTQRTRVVNTISINFKYSFNRLHHRELTYSWASGVSVCDFLVYGHSLCSKDLVRQAANAAGWPIKSAISFTAVYTSGSYNCVTNSGGSRTTIGWLGTSYAGINYVNQQETVVNGAATTTVKRDAAGNAITTTAVEESLNTSYSFCIGAQWVATKRFTQNIVEDYTLTISAPQSVTQYGAITNTETYSITDKYDAGSWENYNSYTSEPSDAVNLVNSAGSPVDDYYIDRDTQRSDHNNAMTVALHKAYTDILKSHRENHVSFEVDLWPVVDLKHTVALSCTRLTAKGKVSKIVHNINVGDGDAWTDVTITLYTSAGSASDSALTIPTKPSYVPIKAGGTVNLQSHYGEDPTTTAARRWTGHIGNRWIETRTNLFRTSYPEAFIVDTPAIEEAARSDKTLAASQSYTLSIPNNTLTITYVGKL